MKRRCGLSPTIAAISLWWIANVVGPARAFHYGCAAERDERKGFPNTAAMEWRKAAELFGPNTRAAEYSWRKWERIMHLPRQLAGPVGVSLATVSPSQFTPVSQPLAIDQMSFANV